MSVESRLGFVDDRTQASNPGGVAVQRWRFALHFPAWPCSLGLALLASLAAGIRWKPLLLGALVLALVNVIYWMRVRLHFQKGCVNPAIVLAKEPFLIGVYTDLTTGENPYPVIKVLTSPVPRGMQCEVGRRCATVALYSGSPDAEHWEDFDPVLLECATNFEPEMERALRSIPRDEWIRLESGLRQLPQPIKRGLYPLRS